MTGARRMRPAGDAGFTLLEVLVAVVVMGIVIGMLSQGLQFGLRVLQLQARSRATQDDLLVVDQALRRMIALADPGTYPEPATLRGAAHTLSMTTELPLDGVGALQRADVTLFVVSGRLVLRWTPHRHADLFGVTPAWRDTVLMEGIERVELAYWGAKGGAGWSTAWTGERLPALVRVSLMSPEASGRRLPPMVMAPLREPAEL